MAKVLWIFYVSKILEFNDTVTNDYFFYSIII